MSWWRADRLAVLAALLGVGHRLVERRLGDAHGGQADHRPRLLEQHQRVLQAGAGRDQHVAGGHAHVVEEQLRGRGAVQTQLVDVAAFVAVLGAVDQDHRQALGALVRGAHDDHAEVGIVAVGDPGLLAGDDKMVAVLLRAAGDLGHVRADAGFADAAAGDDLGAQHARQVLVAHRVVAADLQRVGAELLDQQRDRDVAGDARELLVHQRVGQPRHAHAAVLLGDDAVAAHAVGQHQLEDLQHALLLDQLVGLVALHDGAQLGFEKAVEAFDGQALFFGGQEVHAVWCRFSCCEAARRAQRPRMVMAHTASSMP